MPPPTASMSFQDMVKAAMEEERQRRQAERDALAESAPLARAILDNISQQDTQSPEAERSLDTAQPQAALSQAIDGDHSQQRDRQLEQTARQASDAPRTTPEKENSQPPPPSLKTSRQDNATQKRDAPTTTGKTGNAQKRTKLGPPRRPIEEQLPAAKEVVLAKQDSTQSKLSLRTNSPTRPVALNPADPEAHAALVAHEPVTQTVIPTPTAPITLPDAEISNTLAPQVTASKITTPTATSPKTVVPKSTTTKVTTPKVTTPKVTTLNVTAPRVATPKVAAPRTSAPKSISPKATASKVPTPQVTSPKANPPKTNAPKVRAPKTRAPKIAAPKATASTTTAGTNTAPETDKLNTATSQDSSLRGIKQPRARTLVTPLEPEAELSEAIKHEQSTPKARQAVASVTQVGNALQGAELPSPLTRDSAVHGSTARRISSEDQGSGPLQRQSTTPIPAPTRLTFPTLNGLVGKKRKRPDQDSSASLFVGSTPQPEQNNGASATPVVKNQPGTPTTDSADSPTGSQDNEDSNDPSRTASGHGSRKPPRKKAKNKVYVSKATVDMRGKSTEWYDNIDMKAKFSRGDRATVEYVKQVIKNCVDAAKGDDAADKEKWIMELRDHIHGMERYRFLTPVLVKKSGVLDEEQGGLPLIFAGPDKDIFPWDIALDAEALWGRWIVGDIDGFILRGIVITKTVTDQGRKNTAYRIEDPYPARRSPNVTGNNSLTNGQWWPIRICALRDGAHGEIEAGISGKADYGAYSIVLGASKTNDYPDEDLGDTIHYCGTRSETSTPTASTLLLDRSFETGDPVRVLRAVNKASRYAPKEGLRYDGLYEIFGREVLDPAVALKRFSLRRVAGQDPIRYQGLEARPTSQEMRERMSIRKDLVWS